jgi:hypothetical protein
MDQLQLAMIVMATTDTPWAPRTTDGRHREMTAEELDALVELGWHLPDLKGIMAACAHAMRWPWRPYAGSRVEPAALPPGVATSQG